MGVDFSHGDAHFGHGTFQLFRERLAAMVGIRLRQMAGFGGKVTWSTVTDPLSPLLSRSDAGGVLTPEECRSAAARLRELLADEGRRAQLGGADWEGVLAGLEEAAQRGEPFMIMG
jgi:hypothetical protein